MEFVKTYFASIRLLVHCIKVNTPLLHEHGTHYGNLILSRAGVLHLCISLFRFLEFFRFDKSLMN